MSAPSTAVSNGPAKDMLAPPVTAASMVLASWRRASDAAAAPPIAANAACGCTLNTGNGNASAKRVVTSYATASARNTSSTVRPCASASASSAGMVYAPPWQEALRKPSSSSHQVIAMPFALAAA